MKYFTIIIALFILSIQRSPLGVWLYKEDGSKIEIWEINGKFNGVVIATGNPFIKKGTPILKDLEKVEDKWKGKYYIIKKDRWVDAIIELKGDLLHIELDFDYIHKKFHWYKQKV